jgi:hypothetical protein
MVSSRVPSAPSLVAASSIRAHFIRLADSGVSTNASNAHVLHHCMDAAVGRLAHAPDRKRTGR